MRILILNQYALPAGEAGITRHGDIGADLVRRGHEATVIASDFDYFTRQQVDRAPDGQMTTHAGVRFRWLRTGQYDANDRRRVWSMLRYAMSAVWAGLRQHPGPDVVIGSSPQPLAPLAAYVVARLRRVPWVYEARDIWPSALVDLGAIKRNGRTHRVLEGLERYLYRRADAVVTVPPRGALRLEELGIDPAKSVHIPNGATAILTEPADLPESLAKIVDDWSGKFLLVYTGAIGIPHGFEAVVDAVSLIKASRPEIYQKLGVLIVGDGVAAAPLRTAAAERSIDHLFVHSAVSKAAVRTLLLKADACLMQAAASDHFRFGFSPNKLFDYFAAARPVLIASAHPTLVDEVHAGIRFAPGDPPDLARAIDEMSVLSPAERTAMGERGKRLVDTAYSISSISDRYELLLKRLTHAAAGDEALAG